MRFNYDDFWETASGEEVSVSDMGTSPLMNAIAHCINKPSAVVSMIIEDLTIAKDFVTSSSLSREIKALTQKIYEEDILAITSLPTAGVIEFTLSSVLIQSMLAELARRQVNVEMFVHNLIYPLYKDEPMIYEALTTAGRIKYE